MLLLPSAPRSAHRFSALPGLRSLLVAPDATARGGVVTRTAAAAIASRAATMPCHNGGGEDVVVQASGGGTSIGHCEDIKDEEEDEEEEDVKGAAKEKEAVIGTEEEEELDGFWVSYGRRRPRRRLPPPIPSLVARGALRRTRTADGRLMIRIVPVVRPECIRARRRDGCDRLTMQLVDHPDGSPIVAPPLREPTSSVRQDGNIVRIAREAVAAPEPETATVPAVPSPRASSAGCFEDVFRFDPICGSSLRQMPSLIRMVH